jgi:hypothetical protein
MLLRQSQHKLAKLRNISDETLQTHTSVLVAMFEISLRKYKHYSPFSCHQHCLSFFVQLAGPAAALSRQFFVQLAGPAAALSRQFFLQMHEHPQ